MMVPDFLVFGAQKWSESSWGKEFLVEKTIYREEKVVFTYSITNLGFETMLFDILSSSAVYFFAINKMITVSIIRQ